jgi:predicted DNA-binding WGR domain protein
MVRTRGWIFIVLSLSCAGCGASRHGTCLNGDWYKIGREDGAEGKTAIHHFHNRANTCSAFNFAADERTYLKGRHAGLKEYCTISGMYGHGILAKPYRPVCGNQFESLFRLAYRWGHNASPTVNQLAQVEEAIRNADDQLREERIRPKRKERIRDEIERLEAERARLKHELDRIQRLASNEIGRLRYQLGNKGTDLSHYSIRGANSGH